MDIVKIMIFDDSQKDRLTLELKDEDEWILRVSSIDRLGILIWYILQMEIEIARKWSDS